VSDKTTADVLSRLNPKTRKRVLAASEVTIERVKTPSAGMNQALKGGIGIGRQTLIYGNKSAGKSSLCLQIVAEAQKDGKVCAWVDSEASYDKSWAEKMGVDSESLIYSGAKSINEMTNVCVELMEAGVDLIVVDSISALLPAVYFQKDSEELKNLEDTKQIGSEAKDMTHAVKMLNYVNDNTTLIFISQIRKSFGGLYATNIPTGGEAVKFFSTTVLKLWSSDSDTNAIKRKVKSGDKLVEEKVGRAVTWTVEFNKIAPPGKSGTYDFYYDGEFVGVDTVADLVDMAVKKGIIDRAGAWYTVGESRIQGRDAVISLLRENDELRNVIQGELDGE
jgi:recombination protein RecA